MSSSENSKNIKLLLKSVYGERCVSMFEIWKCFSESYNDLFSLSFPPSCWLKRSSFSSKGAGQSIMHTHTVQPWDTVRAPFNSRRPDSFSRLDRYAWNPGMTSYSIYPVRPVIATLSLCNTFRLIYIYAYQFCSFLYFVIFQQWDLLNAGLE